MSPPIGFTTVLSLHPIRPIMCSLVCGLASSASRDCLGTLLRDEGFLSTHDLVRTLATDAIISGYHAIVGVASSAFASSLWWRDSFSFVLLKG